MAKSTISDEARQERRRQQKEAAYQAAVGKLPVYLWIALAIAVAELLLFFADWANIYNTDIGGTEVSIDGWACLASGLTGEFTTAGGIYKDMAVPFYYYAPAYCGPLASMTVAALIAVVVSIALQAILSVKKLYRVSVAAAIVEAAAGVLLLVCFLRARAMNASDILPYYCSSNPACSIRSYAIIPAILMLCAAAANVLPAVQYQKAQKLLK